jgi:ATP-dependent Lon protease
VRNLEKHIEKICRKLALEVIHASEGDEQLKNRQDW